MCQLDIGFEQTWKQLGYSLVQNTHMNEPALSSEKRNNT